MVNSKGVQKARVNTITDYTVAKLLTECYCQVQPNKWQNNSREIWSYMTLTYWQQSRVEGKQIFENN